MEYFDVLKYVDAGANFYLRVIGDAEHMEILDNGVFETMRSRGDLNNFCSIYNIRLDQLSDEEMSRVIQEIGDKRIHTWWPIYTSERVLDALNGKGARGTFDDGEVYAAMLPKDKPEYPHTSDSIEIKRVSSLAEFATWCSIDNTWEHDGMIAVHPQNHYHLIANGKLRCYLGYVDNIAITTTAILNNDKIASLEFTATRPEYRQQGCAKAVCQYALDDAFANGIRVVSIRAIGHARELAKSLGFDTVVLFPLAKPA